MWVGSFFGWMDSIWCRKWRPKQCSGWIVFWHLSPSSLFNLKWLKVISSRKRESVLVAGNTNLFLSNFFVSRHGGMHLAEDFPTHKRLGAISSSQKLNLSLSLSLSLSLPLSIYLSLLSFWLKYCAYTFSNSPFLSLSLSLFPAFQIFHFIFFFLVSLCFVFYLLLLLFLLFSETFPSNTSTRSLGPDSSVLLLLLLLPHQQINSWWNDQETFWWCIVRNFASESCLLMNSRVSNGNKQIKTSILSSISES